MRRWFPILLLVLTWLCATNHCALEAAVAQFAECGQCDGSHEHSTAGCDDSCELLCQTMEKAAVPAQRLITPAAEADDFAPLPDYAFLLAALAPPPEISLAGALPAGAPETPCAGWKFAERAVAQPGAPGLAA